MQINCILIVLDEYICMLIILFSCLLNSFEEP